MFRYTIFVMFCVVLPSGAMAASAVSSIPKVGVTLASPAIVRTNQTTIQLPTALSHGQGLSTLQQIQRVSLMPTAPSGTTPLSKIATPLGSQTEKFK